MQKIIETDIVIIGAGYAGIAAAKKLHETVKDFIVLEARDRIGGRTLTEVIECGAIIDFGAAWIGPTQYHVWNWVKETNTETFDTYDTGKNILSYKNKISTYKGVIPKIDPISLIDLGLAINKINKLSKQIPIENPWTHPKAKEWDSMTMHTWMQKNLHTKKSRHLFDIGIQTVFGAEASEISFLHALFYCHSGDNMDALISIQNGAQQTILKNGTQGLLKKITLPFEDNIRLNQPVRRIEQDSTGVTVFSDDLIVKAGKCILAVPPVLIDRIQFHPILPQQKAQLFQRMPMGAAMKCFVIYKTPFWRKNGFSGQIVSDEFPVKVTFDVGNKDDEFGKLLVFVEGNDARNFIDLPAEQRKKLVLNKLVKFFGQEAAQPLQYIDKCWTEEEWTRGCYVGLMTPNTMTQFGDKIRTTFQHIHFAGTETAVKWNGYLDGAIESGYRSADEVLKTINY